MLAPPPGSSRDRVTELLFLKVPEPKSGKNRLHLDLRPIDQAEEVVRFADLGATQVDIGQDETATWVDMADPEGNEFCIVRALTAEESWRPDGLHWIDTTLGSAITAPCTPN